MRDDPLTEEPTPSTSQSRRTNRKPARKLALAAHVRACSCDGQVILLDLRHGQYLGIGSAQSNALIERVEGWPRGPGLPRAPEAQSTDDAMLARLLARGLLTETHSSRVPDPPIAEVTATLNAEDTSLYIAIGTRRVARLLASTMLVNCWLRWRSLQSIVTAVEQRRQRLQQPGWDSLAVARGHAAAYEQLRPFFFTTRENCLHDSLTLLTFLASEGVLPRWVIGVKARPFGAHSWLQLGSTVLNDQHEVVRQFRPILVV